MTINSKTAKAEQKYTTKLKVCRNCMHYTSDKSNLSNGYTVEKNKRCGIGKFAVKSLASCEKIFCIR
jgi:hypothetical protein